MSSSRRYPPRRRAQVNNRSTGVLGLRLYDHARKGIVLRADIEVQLRKFVWERVWISRVTGEELAPYPVLEAQALDWLSDLRSVAEALAL